MFIQQVLHTMNAEASTFGARKQYVVVTSLWLSQPCFQDGTCALGDRGTAFLAALADHPDVGAVAQDVSTH